MSDPKLDQKRKNENAAGAPADESHLKDKPQEGVSGDAPAPGGADPEPTGDPGQIGSGVDGVAAGGE